MKFARRGSTHHDRDAETRLLHFLRHMHHLLERWSNQTAQSYGIHLFLYRLLHDLFSWNHDAQVDDVEVIARHHHAYDVFADVVDIALHRSHQYLASRGAATLFLCLDMRLEDRNRRFHRTCGLHNLRQEHLAPAEEFANKVHTVHQRTLNNVHRMRILQQSLVNIRLQELGDALLQRILQTLLNRLFSPFRSRRLLHRSTASLGSCLGCICLRLDFGCQLDKIIGSTLSAVQHHVLDEFKLFFRYLVVIHSRFGIYDTEVHTNFLGVMQEDAMDGFTDISVASEREREVADTTTHVGSRQILMNPLGGTDEFHGIVVVLLHTRSDGEYVRVKDDVERIHAQLVHQQSVSTLSYLDAALKGSSLTHFIEAHHHHGSTIAHHVPGMREEYLLTLLQRDGIDDALALAAFQSSQNHLPFRGVYHHRNLGYLRLSRYHIEEVHHLSLRIQQSVVHIDVYHGSSVSHLLACDTDGFLITFFVNQTQELPATSHVTALTHVHEPAGVHRQMNGVIDLQEVQS